MSKPLSSGLKSLLWGAAAGLAIFALCYGFLTVHQELGVSPNISFPLALLAFALAAAVALIYFRLRTGR